MTTKHWRIFVDWDNDGIAEEAEHGRTFAYQATRGRDRMLNNQSTGFEQQKVGKATLQLDNQDQRFDPFYTSSPLYDNVAPERKIIVGVETGGFDYLLQENGDKLLQENGYGLYLSDGDYYARFTGIIDDIQPSMKSGNRIVKISALDHWRKLRDQTGVWIDTVASTTTNAAITSILDEIAWPDDDRSLSGDGDDLEYWWTTGQKADTEIWDLVHSNLGQIYMSNDGKITYNGRHELYNTTEDVTIDETVLHEDIQTPYMWKTIKNKIRVKTYPVTEQTTIELWRLYDIPLVVAGASTTLWGDLTYQDRPVSATSVTTPAATTDYTMNSASDGTGTNLTANFSVTETSLGRRVKLVVTNNGSVDGYITLLKLRGDAVDTPTTTDIEAEDTDSIYSTSVLDMDLIWQQSTESGNDFANWLVSWLNEPLLFPVVMMEDQDTKTLPYDLFTRVRGDFDTLEIDTDFYISKIVERWISANGQGFAVTWHMEPIDMTEYWVFTTSLGVTSRFAY